MVSVENVTMKFNLERGKVRSLKERLLAKVPEEMETNLFCALNSVSFQVNKGEIFGIIGNNGAGKSTLLKVIAGIMKPSCGKVEVRGSIAPMIELGTGFDFELSAIENIYLSGAVLGYSKSFIQSKVVDILTFSELWDFKDVPVKYYSSGMVARLAFSVSTLVLPDVLIVDEVLSVGDFAFQQKSKKRMLELMESGATIIFVSHDIETIKSICSKVLWLEKGRIRKVGAAKDICQQFVQ